MSSSEFDDELCTCSSIINNDGYKLYCRYWEPKGKLKAIVFIAHGLGEHAQYYNPLACALTNIHCFVLAHDHAGHGRSEGPRASVDNVDKFVQDVFQHTDIIKEKYPGIPIFYIGNSMGGAIGAKAVLERPHYFKGVIFVAAAIVVSPETVSPLLVRLCKLVGWMLPSLPALKLDYTLGSRNKDVIKTRENDPFSLHNYVNLRMTRAILIAMEEIQGNFHVIECPLLALHGEDDKICHIDGAKVLYEKCSSTDKTLKTYPKGYHGLFHEPDGIKEQVTEDIVKWIVERIE